MNSIYLTFFFAACIPDAPASDEASRDADVEDSGFLNGDTAGDTDTIDDSGEYRDTGGDGDSNAEGDTGGDTGGGNGDSGAYDEPTWPADVLDLTNWKITLPLPQDDDPASPMEISQPELDTQAIDPWFRLEGDAVAFRANAGGTTTSGSHYPRSELREMTDDGQSGASWSTTSGVHTMTVTGAITHLPEVKSHVVVGQIHDAADDVVMVRLEGTRLFVEGGGVDLGVLDADYTLGDEYTFRIVAAEGQIDVYYQDMSTPAVRVERVTDGCYFKAGMYTQSNTSKGDAPEAYGEALIRDLTVTHE